MTKRIIPEPIYCTNCESLIDKHMPEGRESGSTKEYYRTFTKRGGPEANALTPIEYHNLCSMGCLQCHMVEYLENEKPGDVYHIKRHRSPFPWIEENAEAAAVLHDSSTILLNHKIGLVDGICESVGG